MQFFSYDAVVVGSGAAGYNAACRLKERGVKVAIVTEGVRCGTSRNTGSDKQTYYKLALGGKERDSVRAMARDLFRGGSVDGDSALVEAALSARAFLHLCELGVPFPVNRYGEYVGYKTDHDPRERATSAGPLTSKFMTEALEKRAKALNIPVHDKTLAVRVLKNEGRVCGLLCLQKDQPVAFHCADVILATGGPAGIYADSVYPLAHQGFSSLAIRAGAEMQNLAFWQYGLASVRPRWNVSGTYMQALPRFYSVDEKGVEHDFLSDVFSDPYEALYMIFLKGYQWPYDEKKAKEGSSRIDLAVFREQTEKGRKVYLDYTRNGVDFDFSRLPEEARSYLARTGADFGTPFQRLMKMNEPAVALYRSFGVDLEKESLPIALCAQHNNGGVAVDAWWQSSVRGLFAVGECAGTHGIARPGGSALNAGQVGSMRAAEYVAAHPNAPTEKALFLRLLSEAESPVIEENDARLLQARRRMSDLAAAVRSGDSVAKALALTRQERQTARDERLCDTLLTQEAVLTAMASPLTDPKKVQLVRYENGSFSCWERPVRPLPKQDDVFEVVWAEYRKDRNCR